MSYIWILQFEQVIYCFCVHNLLSDIQIRHSIQWCVLIYLYAVNQLQLLLVCSQFLKLIGIHIRNSIQRCVLIYPCAVNLVSMLPDIALLHFRDTSCWLKMTDQCHPNFQKSDAHCLNYAVANLTLYKLTHPQIFWK